MRASVIAESAGVPTVSIVCEGFERQALATGRGLGLDDLALAVLQGHVDAQSHDEMVASFLAHTVDQIVRGLTQSTIRPDAGEPDAGEPDAGEPAAGEPDAGEPAAGEPDAGEPDDGEPDDGEPGDTAAAGDVQPTARRSGDASVGAARDRRPDPAALDVVVSGTVDDVHRAFLERGWSDGSPIVPPTVERVQALLDGTGHDPFRVIGRARPSGRDITVWSIAVNAVMAGLEQRHLPVLLAIADVLVDPAYGVEHSGNTTGADALVVVSGPSIAELGFNCEVGALREGTHANTAVARWLRLYLRNVCGFTSAEHDKATFGNSARVVLAEHDLALAEIGWPSLAVDLGAAPGVDTVAMARMNSGLIIGSVFGSTPAEVVPYLANGLVRATGWELTHVFGLGHRSYRPLLVLSPLIARMFARHGWSKGDVQRALFDEARLPARTFEAFIGAWSNLTAGRRTLVDLVADGTLPEVFALGDDPDRLVPIVAAPDELLLAVAGDPHRANAFVMSNDGRHGDWTTATIDRSVSLDLACRIDRPDLCG